MPTRRIVTSNLVRKRQSLRPRVLHRHLLSRLASTVTDNSTERDDKEAIDSSNILDGDKTRHAKPKGGYAEPGDTEGLPENDGTSAVAQ